MDTIKLTQAEREELNRWVRGQSYSSAQSRRARLILLMDAGERFNVIRSKLSCDTNFIARWKSRFLAERIAGLFSRHGGRAPDKDSERKEARILKWTIQKRPADGSSHWSQRKLAGELVDVSHMTIAGSGLNTGLHLIVWTDIWRAMTRSLRARPPILLACT